MYSILINDLENNNICHYNWPFDQHYISKYILNTPIGNVLRHNWWKNEMMYYDLNLLYHNINVDLSIDKSTFIEEEFYDENIFPNIDDNGHEYQL